MNILEVTNITKDFTGTRALDDVTFTVKEGEIHCLCGENGAGKSTLMKVISGVIPFGEYQGNVAFKGDIQKNYTVKDSERKGIAIVHQELALSPYLSIAENIFLGHQKSRFGIIDFITMTKEAELLLQKVGLQEDPQTIVSTLGLGKQQLVEIAKALSKNIQLLIFDEPTSSLNDSESDHLLDFILALKKEGITSIMISHKLNEVIKIADSITILRDGKTIRTLDATKDNVTEDMIIKDMVGRDLSNRFPPKPPHTPTANTLLEVKNWNVYHPQQPDRKVLSDINFSIKGGEIVGFCGLMGAGRTELMMSVFGLSYGSRQEGEIYFKGKKKEWKTPKNTIADGLGYVSEDRKELGLITIQDIKTNITNSNLQGCSQYGVTNNAIIERASIEYKQKFDIRTPTVHELVSSLSGGNQQKVVLSRCLYADPELLIVDEPTRGIDVGAKYEIYSILHELVTDGKSIIIVSSELEEVLGVADRVYVMSQGRITGQMDVKDATQEKIMSLAIGL